MNATTPELLAPPRPGRRALATLSAWRHAIASLGPRPWKWAALVGLFGTLLDWGLTLAELRPSVPISSVVQFGAGAAICWAVVVTLGLSAWAIADRSGAQTAGRAGRLAVALGVAVLLQAALGPGLVQLLVGRLDPCLVHECSGKDFSSVPQWLLNSELSAKQKNGGAGLRILSGAVTSPTLVDQIRRLLAKFPQAKWHHFEPINSDNARLGAKLAFGRLVQTVYHFDKAKVICSLDANFLLDGPGAVRYAREFSDGRRVRAGVDKEGKPSGLEKTKLEMSRLYVAESTPSITGAMADHRIRVQARVMEQITRELAKRIGVGGAGGRNLSPEQMKWVESVVADLRGANGASVVVAGAWQTPVVHALAHAMNDALGNIGKTVTYHEAIEAHDQEAMASLRLLVNDMNSGAVDLLLILGPNPIQTAPADLKFEAAISNVRLRVPLAGTWRILTRSEAASE